MIGYEVIRVTDEWEQTVIIKFTILGKQKTKQSDDRVQLYRVIHQNMSLAGTAKHCDHWKIRVEFVMVNMSR